METHGTGPLSSLLQRMSIGVITRLGLLLSLACTRLLEHNKMRISTQNRQPDEGHENDAVFCGAITILRELTSLPQCEKIMPLTEDRGVSTSTISITKATLLKNMRINPNGYQVSTLAHMLGTLFGRIPLRGRKDIRDILTTRL